MSPESAAVVWEVMKWPLAACLLLPPLLVYLGLHIVEREVIFVDLALAQMAALGTCIAPFLGYDFHDRVAFAISLGMTFAAAALFSALRASRNHRVPQEAIIGITFAVAAAAVILLLSKVSGGKEELEHLLAGDILNVTQAEVAQRAALFAALAVFYGALHRRLAQVSTDAEAALAQGLRVRLLDFGFYAAFGLVVVSFVPIAGVLLTFTYLIVPAVCGVMLADRWGARLVLGWGIAIAASLLGLWSSYEFDVPTGAAIVCTHGLVLVSVSLAAQLRGAG